MERRNRSIESLNRLVYIDSLDEESLRARLLADWVNENLVDRDIQDFDLELKDLKNLSELIYKNITFLKNYKSDLKSQLNSNQKIKQFLN